MSNRRRERERRRRLAHAEVAPRDENDPRPERAPKAAKVGNSSKPGRKPVPAPSLQRSLKRAALVLVVLSALIYVVDHGKHAIGADVLQASLGALFFVPFDFMLTRIMYNRVGKRLGS
ncbi:MAG TPA: hypothetical protein VGF46_02805 [Gaiellales bacterium]|jgi:hypothetical protein